MSSHSSHHRHRHHRSHKRRLWRRTRRIALAVVVILFIALSYWFAVKDSIPLVFLGAENLEWMSLNTLLDKYPALVIIIGTLVCIAWRFLPRKARPALLVAYVLFILFETLLTRTPGEMKYNFDLFWSYRQFMTSDVMRHQVLNNIWLFIPYGVGVFYTVKNRRWRFTLFLLPIVIEMVQGITGLGLFELDDIFGNVVGEIIGLHIYKLIRKRQKCYFKG